MDAFSLPELMISVGISSALVYSLWLMVTLFHQRTEFQKQKYLLLEKIIFWNEVLESDFKESSLIKTIPQGFQFGIGTRQIQYLQRGDHLFRWGRLELDSIQILDAKVCRSENRFGKIDAIVFRGRTKDSLFFSISGSKHYTSAEMLELKRTKEDE